MMKYWQIFGLVGILGFLIALMSFKWGYTEGKLKIIEAWLEVAVKGETREISND